jgi:hypothetical protein
MTRKYRKVFIKRKLTTASGSELDCHGRAEFKSTVSIAGPLTLTTPLVLPYGVRVPSASTDITADTSVVGQPFGKVFTVSGGPFTITLPSPSTALIGGTYKFVVGGAVTGNIRLQTGTGSDAFLFCDIVGSTGASNIGSESDINFLFGGSTAQQGDFIEFTYLPSFIAVFAVSGADGIST